MPILDPRRSVALAAFLCAAAVGACVSGEPESSESSDDEELGETSDALTGRQLFEEATFGGNGRTCETCHSQNTGTLNPQQVENRFQNHPDGPLFRSIDSDDGEGNSYTRLRSRATIRVTIPLPPNIRVGDDPTATEVVLERGIPTTTNVATAEFLPNEDGRTFLMYDFRRGSLEEQAGGAIQDHYQPGLTPTANQLQKIADFERDANRFYSSPKIRHWVQDGGEAPKLPKGNTQAQKRGRTFFEAGGRCESCHSGPLMNQTTEAEVPFQPVGAQWASAFAGELLPDQMPQPFRDWIVSFEPGEVPEDICFGSVDQDAGTCTVSIPDPLRMLASGELADFAMVKIPTLWGVNKTAPYFHDNSAVDLEAVLRQYNEYFTLFGDGPLPPQDQADIIAYMKLL